jgi:MoxR-like ATPase
MRATFAATASRVVAAAAEHAWLPPSWRAEIDTAHAQRVDGLQQLRDRMQAVRDGFAALPVDTQAPAERPAPVPLLA